MFVFLHQNAATVQLLRFWWWWTKLILFLLLYEADVNIEFNFVLTHSSCARGSSATISHPITAYLIRSKVPLWPLVQSDIKKPGQMHRKWSRTVNKEHTIFFIIEGRLCWIYIRNFSIYTHLRQRAGLQNSVYCYGNPWVRHPGGMFLIPPGCFWLHVRRSPGKQEKSYHCMPQLSNLTFYKSVILNYAQSLYMYIFLVVFVYKVYVLGLKALASRLQSRRLTSA